MKINLIFVVFLLLSISSCKTGGIFSSGKKKIKNQADLFVAQTDSSWKVMLESDDNKIADIKRLLLEISYTENHDSKKLKDLQQKAESLIALRYKQNSMRSEEIDNYDLATASLVKETLDFAEETKELESHPIAESLKNEILDKDNEVIMYRIRYDQDAKEFNSFLEKNGGKLNKLGSPYSSYKKLPLFELPE